MFWTIVGICVVALLAFALWWDRRTKRRHGLQADPSAAKDAAKANELAQTMAAQREARGSGRGSGIVH